MGRDTFHCPGVLQALSTWPWTLPRIQEQPQLFQTTCDSQALEMRVVLAKGRSSLSLAAGVTLCSPVAESLPYTDDTAMSRSVVQSLLAKQEFDEVDMAKR